MSDIEEVVYVRCRNCGRKVRPVKKDMGLGEYLFCPLCGTDGL